MLCQLSDATTVRPALPVRLTDTTKTSVKNALSAGLRAANPVRVWNLKGMTTTAFSDHPNSMLNRGIMKRVSREKLKDGRYKLKYETDWHEGSWADALAWWLKRAGSKDSVAPADQAGEGGATPTPALTENDDA